MNRSNIVIAALAVFAVASAANAHLVASRGGANCETWTMQRPQNAKLLETWLLGYLSGLAQGADHDFPKGMDDAALFRWMDAYCRQNATQTIALGGFMLMGQLRAGATSK